MSEEVDIDGLVDYYLGSLSPAESTEHIPDDAHDHSVESIEACVDDILRGVSVSATKKPLDLHPSHCETNLSLAESSDSDDLQRLSQTPDVPLARATSLRTLSRSQSAALPQRMALWEERREARRLQSLYTALLDEQAACPFRPRVAERSRSEGRGGDSALATQVMGSEGFLQRMANARERREARRREAEAEALRYADHTTWNPRATVPKPFVLGRPPRRVTAVSAQMDTFGRYGAAMRAQMEEKPSRIEGPSLPGGLFSLPSSQAVIRCAESTTSV